MSSPEPSHPVADAFRNVDSDIFQDFAALAEWKSARNYREAVDEVIREHARLGVPLYIGHEGKVVRVSPTEVRVLSRSVPRK